MSQSRLGSVIEAKANSLIGIPLSIIAAPLVYPLFGMEAPMSAYLGVTAVYYCISVARNYIVRRTFEWINARRLRNAQST